MGTFWRNPKAIAQTTQGYANEAFEGAALSSSEAMHKFVEMRKRITVLETEKNVLHEQLERVSRSHSGLAASEQAGQNHHVIERLRRELTDTRAALRTAQEAANSIPAPVQVKTSGYDPNMKTELDDAMRKVSKINVQYENTSNEVARFQALNEQLLGDIKRQQNELREERQKGKRGETLDRQLRIQKDTNRELEALIEHLQNENANLAEANREHMRQALEAPKSAMNDIQMMQQQMKEQQQMIMMNMLMMGKLRMMTKMKKRKTRTTEVVKLKRVNPLKAAARLFIKTCISAIATKMANTEE